MTEHCSHSDLTSCTQPSSEQVAIFLQQAADLCDKRNLRFTRLRKQVLELVCRAEQPVGAYHLLDELKQSGRSAAPPTVYRALDFLLEQGLVHRLSTNNTYLACAHPQHPHGAVFLVCSECGHTQEVHNEGVNDELDRQAKQFDFAIQHAAVEVTGLCSRCRGS
ncbi:MAG: transcriptional repressor [Thiotrichales bacterium]|nr:MAG: transcriptional repressor [Thiotrichales bacterium]